MVNLLGRYLLSEDRSSILRRRRMADVGARSGGEGGELENGGAGMERLVRRTSEPSTSALRRPRSPGAAGPKPCPVQVASVPIWEQPHALEVGDEEITLIMYASGVLFANF